jgi:anti-sigma factor RsiW
VEITRNVILDLIPLYLDGEVSADTRALVDEYLAADPELATIVQHLAKTELSGDIPVPLTQEDEMQAYKEAKRLMFLRTLVIAVLVASGFLCTLGFSAAIWLGAFRFLQ